MINRSALHRLYKYMPAFCGRVRPGFFFNDAHDFGDFELAFLPRLGDYNLARFFRAHPRSLFHKAFRIRDFFFYFLLSVLRVFECFVGLGELPLQPVLVLLQPLFHPVERFLLVL